VPTAPARAPIAVVFGALLVLAAGATPAAAAVDGTDLVGGRQAGSSATLTAQAPGITAPAGYLMTADGKVLWARLPDQRRAMASLTKVMTALVVLDETVPSRVVTVTAAATAVGESVAGIQAGDRLTVQQLLEAMLVKSGNEAATALAIDVGGSVGGFAKLMNEKAAALGLKDTHFANPHGLDQSGHYTSARDLAALGAHAMRDPRFRAIVAKRRITLTGKAGRRTLDATDVLLGKLEGAEGIKTGFTRKAGYSFLGAVKRGGIELISVILGTRSESARFRQTAKLMDWGFRHYRSTVLGKVGAPAGAAAVADYLDRTVPLAVAETTSVPVFDLAGPVEQKWDVRSTVSAPVAKGKEMGTLTFVQAGKNLATVTVTAAAAVPAPGSWEAFTIWLARTWRSVAGGVSMAPSVAPPAAAPATP
jgi:D-alanyl-D-alanine carboxypeptidase (penicillin-binding protein 5/6)